MNKLDTIKQELQVYLEERLNIVEALEKEYVLNENKSYF